MTASARQPVGADRVELSAGGKDKDLVGRLRRECELQAVAFLEGQLRQIRQMPLHRAQPALRRDDYGHRLLLDHRVMDIGKVVVGRVREGRAALAQFRVLLRPEIAADFLDLPGDRLPLLRLGSQQRLDLGLFGGQSPSNSLRISISSSLRSCAQAQVEDGFGLDVGQRPPRHHHLLGLVLLADDADHLIDVEIGDQVAREDFQPPLDLGQPVLRTADQHFLAVLEPLLQHRA